MTLTTNGVGSNEHSLGFGSLRGFAFNFYINTLTPASQTICSGSAISNITMSPALFPSSSNLGGFGTNQYLTVDNSGYYFDIANVSNQAIKILSIPVEMVTRNGLFTTTNCGFTIYETTTATTSTTVATNSGAWSAVVTATLPFHSGPPGSTIFTNYPVNLIFQAGESHGFYIKCNTANFSTGFSQSGTYSEPLTDGVLKISNQWQSNGSFSTNNSAGGLMGFVIYKGGTSGSNWTRTNTTNITGTTNAGNSSSSTYPIHGTLTNNTTTPQTTTYSVTLTDINGNTSTTAASVTVNPLPNAGITGGSTQCTPASLTASGGTSYLWSNGATTATVSLTTSGTYTVTVAANSCSASTSQTITVAGPPTITSFAPSSGNVGTSVVITGTNFNATPSNNIVYFGAVKAVVTAASATSLTATVPAGSTYDYITVKNGCNYTGYSKLKFNPTFNCGGIAGRSFASPVTYSSTFNGTGEQAVAAVDLDGDGKPEMISSHYNYSTHGGLSVYLNTATLGVIDNNTFASQFDIQVPLSGGNIKIGDLNSDGKKDFVVANYATNQITIIQNNSTTGNLVFGTPINFSSNYNMNGITINDFDGDGKVDFIATSANVNNISVYRNVSSSSTLDGSSFYQADITITGVSSLWDIASGDIDGDGKADLAISAGNGTTYILLNTSNGSISFAAPFTITTSSSLGGIELVDMNNDGKLDIVENYNGQAEFIKNTSGVGTLSFDSPVLLNIAASRSTFIAAGDINGDGKVDLVYPNYFSNLIDVVSNSTNGTSITTTFDTAFALSGNPNGVFLCDIDGDGKPELIANSWNVEAINVYKNISNLIPTISPTSPVSICTGSSTTLTAGSGYSSYLWSNSATTQSITVSASGTYSVQVNGCSGTASQVVTVNPLPTPSISGTNPYCAHLSSTTLNAGSYNSYLWTGGATTQTIAVSAGTYTVTVTDANTCTSATSVVVTTMLCNTVSCAMGTTTFCAGATSSVDYTIIGTYNAGNIFTAQLSDASGSFASPTSIGSVTSTSAGSISISIPSNAVGTGYRVRVNSSNPAVTGANNGTDIIVYSNPFASIGSHIDVNCFGNANGLLSVDAAGGGGSFTYLWSLNSSTSTFITSLVAGTYSVTVTDNHGCTSTTSAIVTQPSLLTTSSSSGTINCYGQSTSVTINASGGSTAYTGTGVVSNVTAGTYTYTVSDAHGCTASTSLTITQPVLGTFGSSNVNPACNGAATGSIGVTNLTGGTGLKTYSNNGGSSFQLSNSFTGLSVGTYSMEVTYGSGCTSTFNVVLSQPTTNIFTTTYE